MPSAVKSIVIIGSGNVASIFGRCFYEQGFEIRQIVSRNKDHAHSLAKDLDCHHSTHQFHRIVKDADLYLIAVKDDAIKSVVTDLPLLEGIVVHCSGATSISTLAKFQNAGIFYPLQTFTKGRNIPLQQVPFLIDGSNQKTIDTLFNLGKSISSQVYLLDDEQREKAHLIAVIFNNFINHLITLGDDLAKTYQLPSQMFNTLLKETVDKAVSLESENAQTGPAKRNDTQTIQKHLKLIEDAHHYTLLSLYQTLSKSIQERFHQAESE
ncbi:MAG: F420-dependent NADP oxidoreductase [Chitinophagales bacterium]|nr:F420-dependent NADP oxidoreductase [Chitinophagales bacterium]